VSKCQLIIWSEEEAPLENFKLRRTNWEFQVRKFQLRILSEEVPIDNFDWGNATWEFLLKKRSLVILSEEAPLENSSKEEPLENFEWGSAAGVFQMKKCHLRILSEEVPFEIGEWRSASWEFWEKNHHFRCKGIWVLLVHSARSSGLKTRTVWKCRSGARSQKWLW